MWRNKIKKRGIKMPDFSEAEVGDRVFSILSGWGEIADTKGAVYPLLVKFNVGSSNCYIMDGRLDSDDIRADLYWDEVTLDVPESALTPPKRKVKKQILLDPVMGRYYDAGKAVILGPGEKRVCMENLQGPFEIEVEE